jgi:putative addiction module killer protein
MEYLSIEIDMIYEVVQTEIFAKWMNALRDRKAQTIIAARIDRVRVGNMGNCKSLGGGLSELKVNFGPGYRLYFTIEGGQVVILLAGGDKSSQARDIAVARDMI